MVSALLNVSDAALTTPIVLCPNPSKGDFTVNLGKNYADVTIQITDALGKIISTSKHSSVKIIDQEVNGPSGIYFVNVSANVGFLKSFKLIKN